MLHRRDLVRLIALATLLLAVAFIPFFVTSNRETNNSIIPTLMVLPTDLPATDTPTVPSTKAAAAPTGTPSPTASETDPFTETSTPSRTTTFTSLPTDTPTNTATEQASSTPRPTAAPSTTIPYIPPATAAPFPVTLPSAPVPNQVVITFASEASLQERAAYIQSIGGEVEQTIASLDTVVVEIPQAIQELPPSDVVAAAEPDYYVSALVAVPPNDPLYPNQWSLPAIEGLMDAWRVLATDAALVAVAVIDSGICADHPDLSERILPGYDFVDDDPVPQDDFGHGCSVAGIVAANIDDGLGIAGVAPNARVMPLRVLNAQGVGLYSNVAAAIVYAADQGAQVINLSLGGPNRSTTLENAVDYAVSKGVTVVAAAGNTGGSVLYPAAYERVVAVGSLDRNGERSSFSSHGPEIDVWAPGRDVLSTRRSGDWGLVTGTSFAAPHVAAAVALESALGQPLESNGGVLRLSSIVMTPAGTPSSEPTPDGVPQPVTGDPADLPLVPGNVELADEAEAALREVITQEQGRGITASNYYSVSALNQEGDWYFVSVVGLIALDPDVGWRLDDANWFGLVLLHQQDDGSWRGAVEGTTEYTQLLAQVPASALSLEAKQEIDPLQWDVQAAEAYRFPWQSGTNMVYGSLGVHNNGFAGVVTGWKAVDMLSNGDTGAGYAPNRLLASASGSISYVCDDGTSVAIRIGNLFYSHLMRNGNLRTGRSFNQSDELGQLRTGTFDNRCGYGSQGANWFHVHWGFPNTGTFSVEDWTLNLTDGVWRRGSEARSRNSLLMAGENYTPPAANVNLLTNGDFSAGVAGWAIAGLAPAQVSAGVFETALPMGTPSGALYQYLNQPLPANAPLEMTVQLGNSSASSKTVQLLLRTPDWSVVRSCMFTIPAGSPMQTYTMRTLTGSPWNALYAQLWLHSPDSQMALRADNLNLQYKPGLPITTTDCLEPTAPANVNLLVNGDFSAGVAGWAIAGLAPAQVSAGVFEMALPMGTPSGALYQYVNQPLPANAPLEMTVQLGNSSASSKTVQLLLRTPDWSVVRSCMFTVPAGSPMRSYAMRTMTGSTGWAGAYAQLWLHSPDSQMALRADNLNFQYRPSLSLGGTKCEDPASINLLVNGDFSAGVAGWAIAGLAPAQVSAGVFETALPMGTPSGALYQYLNQPLPANAPLEMTVQLGNSSASSKTVQLLLRTPDWSVVRSCMFTIPAGSPMQTYTMRTLTGSPWNALYAQLWLHSPDSQMALRVDNVSLQYKPSLNLSGTQCLLNGASVSQLGVEDALATLQPASMPSATPSPSSTATATATAQASLIHTATSTPTPTASVTATLLPTDTPLPTNTAIPTASSTTTFTPTPTETPLPPETVTPLPTTATPLPPDAPTMSPTSTLMPSDSSLTLPPAPMLPTQTVMATEATS